MNKWLHIPNKKDLLLLFGLVVLYLFVYLFLQDEGLGATDSFSAYPITVATSDPSTYSKNDLLVEAGISGNFVFYKLLSYVPFFKDNFVVRDVVLGFPFFVLYIFAWYNLFFELSKDKKITFACLFFLLFADGKFGLNWSSPSVFGLNSITLVHFLQIFSILFFLKKKFIVSFALLSLTTYFHPASGMVFLSVLGSVLLLECIREKNIKMLVKPAVASLLILLPNIFMLRHGVGSSIDTKTYFDIFYNFQTHAYLEDHFREGYLYTLAIFGVLLIDRFKNIIALEHKKTITAFVVFSFLGSLVWLLNVYYIHSVSVVYTFFITRIFYIVRPLFILFTLLCAKYLFEQKKFSARLMSFFLLLSLIEFTSIQGMLIVLPVLVYFSIFRTRLEQIFLESKWRYVAGVAAFVCYGSAIYLRLTSGNFLNKIFDHISAQKNLLIFSISMGVAFLVLVFHKKIFRLFSSPRIRFVHVIVFVALLVGVRFLVFQGSGGVQLRTLEKSRNYGYDAVEESYHELVNWAKEFKGKMFVVPPYDNNFGTFRYLAHNSLYIHHGDINQLMYSEEHYYKGFKRLEELGIKVQKRRTFDWSAYNNLSIDYLKNTKGDFVIFDKSAEGFSAKEGVSPIYENTKYAVYTLN